MSAQLVAGAHLMEHTTYSDDLQTKTINTKKGDILHGPTYVYERVGPKWVCISEDNYCNGQLNGVCLQWHLDKRVKRMNSYRFGMLVGSELTIDEDGTYKIIWHGKP